MQPQNLSRSLRLHECPQWATQHTLPRPVVVAVERTMWVLRAAGRPARRQDVVGLAIISFAPDDPVALRRLLVRPHPELGCTVADLPTGRYAHTLRANTEQVWLRLPSPVSLRLNLLVENVQALGFATTRRQVLSAVVLHGLSRDRRRLQAAFDAYIAAPAEVAAVTGRPLNDVLGSAPPRPGRRPFRA